MKTLLPTSGTVLSQTCESCKYESDWDGTFVLKHSTYDGKVILFDFFWRCECGHQNDAYGEIDPRWFS